MTERELQKRRYAKQDELIENQYVLEKAIDQDLFNLKYMLYGIVPYSRYWRWGMMKSLKRAIKLIEKEEV